MLAKTLFLISQLLFTFSAFAELTGQPNAETPVGRSQTSGSCSPDQKTENEEILKYCEANWDNWGVTEKPPAEELLSTTKCSSGSENALNGCGAALMAIPVMLGELTVLGLVSLTPDDKSSLAYIAQNGTLQDMQAYYANQYLREKCKLGSSEDDNKFINSNCRKPSLERIDCNPFLEQVRTAVQCRRSSETRRAYRQDEQKSVLAPAQKLYDEQQARKAAEIKYKNDLAKLRSTCGPIMNPYSESYTKMFLNPLNYMGTATANYLKPDAATVAKYNQCLADNSKENPALQEELKKNGAGLIGSMVGGIESLKCYRQDLQAQFKCEIAAAVLTGGTGAGLTAVKKLGRSAVDRQLARAAGRASAEVAEAAPKIFPLAPATLPRTNAIEEFIRKTGRDVEVRSIPGVGDVLYDNATNQPLFRFDYRVDARDGIPKFKKITAEVGLDSSRENFLTEAKGNGFYSYFFNRMVQKYPNVKMLHSDLWYDNLDAFRKNIDAGYSPLEAYKGTPAYRVYMQNGFTEIKPESIRINYDSSGKISGVTATVVKP